MPARSLLRASYDARMAWIVIATLGAATSFGLWSTGFIVMWPSLLHPVCGALALYGATCFYRSVRREERLASSCEALAQLVLFTMIAGPLSYLAAGLDRPLQDARLVHADRLMGFDWRAYLAWINAHPALHGPLRLAYDTLLPQLAAAILLLGLTGRRHQLRILVWSVIASAVVSIAVSAIWPAVGGYAHFNLHAAVYSGIQPSDAWTHVPDFLGVRDGTLRTLALDRMQGIIAFPSFHAALGVIFAWAYWQSPWTRWPGLAIEAALLLSTPVDGAHYLSDIVAGCLLAFASIGIAERALLTGRSRPTSALAPAIR